MNQFLQQALQLQQRMYEVVKGIYAPSPAKAVSERRISPGQYEFDVNLRGQDVLVLPHNEELDCQGYTVVNMFAVVNIIEDSLPGSAGYTFTLDLLAANNTPLLPVQGSAGSFQLTAAESRQGRFNFPVIRVDSLLAQSVAWRLRLSQGVGANAERRIKGRMIYQLVLGRTY